jgi:hypothetical protein
MDKTPAVARYCAIEITAPLERDGFDTSPLKAALLQLEELQGMLIADRDRLKKELDENHHRVPIYLDELDLLSFWPRGEK